MDRIAVVDKRFYSQLMESLDMLDRIVGEPPADLWTDDLREKVDMRFPMGLRLFSMTPEGPRALYFMRGLD